MTTQVKEKDVQMTTQQLFTALDGAISEMDKSRAALDKAEEEQIAEVTKAQANLDKTIEEHRKKIEVASTAHSTAMAKAKEIQAEFARRTSGLIESSGRIRTSN